MNRTWDLTELDGDTHFCGVRIPKRNKRCDMPAGAGTDHLGYGKCRWHGGNSPALRKQAEREMHRMRQENAVQILGLKVKTTPEDALSEELWRTLGIVQWLEESIRGFEQDDDGTIEVTYFPAVGDPVQMRMKPAEAVANGSTSIGQLYKMLVNERHQLARVSNMGVQAGLTERALAIEEDKVRQVASLLNEAIAASGLNPSQQTAIRSSFRKVIEGKIAS